MPLSSLSLLGSLLLHVPAAMTWIGVVLLNAVATTAPGLEAQQRLGLMRRAAPFAWVAFGILVATGIWQTINNPVTQEPATTWAVLEELRQTPYGTALLIKHVFVVLTGAVAFTINFVLSPRFEAALAVGTHSAAPLTLTMQGPRLQQRLAQLAWLNVTLSGLLLACVAYIIFTLR